jgi:hypothetical protein
LPWSIIGNLAMLSGGPYLGSDEQVRFQTTLTTGHRHVVQDAERRNDVSLGMNAGNFIDRTVKALPLPGDFISPCAQLGKGVSHDQSRSMSVLCSAVD